MSSGLSSIPYWRLSGFYFFNCAVLGAMLPYWALYMQSLNYSAFQIGLISAILMASNIIAPYSWGWLCDRLGHRLRVIQWGTLAAVVSFCGLFISTQWPVMILCIAACSFCWQGLNSQFEIITLGHLRGQPHRYSQIRLWGSVGFVSMVSGLGFALDYFSITWLPWIVAGLLLLMWVNTLLVSEQSTVADHVAGSIQSIIRKPAVWGLLLAVTLAYFSHGSYYGFFSVYLSERGESNTVIGVLWTIAVAAELLVFAVMSRLQRTFTLRAILLFSLAMTALRWLGIGFMPDVMLVLVICQLLHGLSFSAVHALVIELIRQYFGDDQQGKGQAMYSSVCVGVGQSSGTLISGLIWDWSPQSAFALSAITAVIAFIVAWRWVYPRGEISNS